LEDATLSLPEMSPAVERAVQAAHGLAYRERSRDTRPIHILAALLQEEEGKAAILLSEAGLAREALLTHLGLSESELSEVQVGAQAAAISQTLLVAFRGARSLAVDLTGERSIASEHLLLAILEADSSLAQMLIDLGLRKEMLERAIRGDLDIPLAVEELDLRDPTDWTDAARILDANANRAREGLRVVEDYCRFVLDDRLLIEETKQIRHSLSQALGSLPIQSRDTMHDVGVTVSTSQEGIRNSPRHVLLANLKRIQEALRSIEEYAKFALTNAGRVFEQLRYRSYTLERMLLLHEDASARLHNVRLYVLLTRRLAAASLEWTIQEAAAGGAGVFQLREKDYSDREFLQVARDVRRWTQATKTLFIVNDRPDIARLVDADGVHLGQDDMSVKDARRILGPQALIGVSTHAVQDIHRAVADGASYLGIGPTFSSGTKSFDRLAGLDFVREAARLTTLPWFAIGGIQLSNVAEVVDAGARRIAVSQAVIAAEEPRMAAAGLVQELEPSKQRH
jgi:thiamine-phosphate pyrophosphorylase